MKGQALLESLFSYIFIIFVTFCVIEVIRLQSTKMLLQASVNYYTKHTALDEMRLIRQNQFQLQYSKAFSPPTLIENLQKSISQDLALIGTSLISFDSGYKYLTKHNLSIKLDLLPKKTKSFPAGVHIKATMCLPILFSSFLNRFIDSKEIIIGRSINDNDTDRNCLGEFINSKNSPKIWFRIRAAAYSPWPSSTQIYYFGLAAPQTITFIDSKQREKIKDKISFINFTGVFNEKK